MRLSKSQNLKVSESQTPIPREPESLKVSKFQQHQNLTPPPPPSPTPHPHPGARCSLGEARPWLEINWARVAADVAAARQGVGASAALAPARGGRCSRSKRSTTTPPSGLVLGPPSSPARAATTPTTSRPRRSRSKQRLSSQHDKIEMKKCSINNKFCSKQQSKIFTRRQRRRRMFSMIHQYPPCAAVLNN